MHEAMFYTQAGDGKVVCGLCHHRCRIAPGGRGRCGVRENQDGRLISLVYGRLVAESIDPIEKKPMFHLLPGSSSFSIATVGCNFACLHCQNAGISQYPSLHHGQISGVGRSPAAVVAQAEQAGCASISYTYVEPTIFYEFAYDCAVLAKARGIKNVFVSNGYMTGEVVRHLAPVLDGINIDLKSFSADFYQQVCKARLEPVLDTIRLFHELGVLVETTTLVIPGLNDGDDELRAIARFPPQRLGQHPLACERLPPDLQNARPPRHPGRDPEPGAGDRAGRRAALCLHRQCCRLRRRGHPLSRLHHPAGPPQRLQQPATGAPRRPLRQLPTAHRRGLAVIWGGATLFPTVWLPSPVSVFLREEHFFLCLPTEKNPPCGCATPLKKGQPCR